MKKNTTTKCQLMTSIGFSLIEVITVIALMAVMAAVSAPAFIEWQQNLSYKQSANELANALKTAKSKAITFNQPHGVTVIPSERSYQFARYSATTNEWAYFGVKSILPAQVVLNLNSAAGSAVSPTPNIRFNANGSTFDNYSIRVRDASSGRYTVSIERSGRIRFYKAK